MAGRGRVGLGQPDVHGRDAGLGAEAQQGQHEQDRGQRHHGAFLEGQGSKGRIARVLPEQAEEGQQQHGTQVGGHQIDPRSVAHVAVAVVEVDEEEGRQGHDFPGQQEEHGVTGHHDHGHAQHQQQIEEPVGGQVVFAGAGVAQRDASGTGTDEAQAEDRQQEDAGKGVQPQTQTAHGQAPGLGPQQAACPAVREQARHAQGTAAGGPQRTEQVGQPGRGGRGAGKGQQPQTGGADRQYTQSQ